jgi:hypothetical protein
MSSVVHSFFTTGDTERHGVNLLLVYNRLTL